MFKAILAASAITLATAAAGTAAPLATAGVTIDNASQSLVIDVRDRDRDRDRDRHRHRSNRHHRHNHHVHSHDRYRGWHRYSARPWNWQTRGCVAVGPVWVCP
jgi:Ni/Co efflux regulator RcnB